MHGTVQSLPETDAANRGADMQKHTRFSLFVPATLMWDDGDLPCTLHNISAGGAKVRAGTPIAAGTLLTLQIDCHSLRGEVVWSHGEYSGIGFHEDPDEVQTLIETELLALPSRLERRAYRRCSVLMNGTLFVDGQPHGCVVKNLSLGGARIVCDAPLDQDRAVILEMKRFGMFPARVVWDHKGDYGLSFAIPPSQVAAMVGEVLPSCMSESEEVPPKPQAAAAAGR